MSTGALGRLGRWGPPCSRRSADYRHVAVWLYCFGPTELGTPSRRLLRPQAGRARKRIHPRSGAAAGGQSTVPPVRSVGELGPAEGVSWHPMGARTGTGPSRQAGRRPGPRCRGISRCQCSADRCRRESAAASHAGRQWGGAVGWCCAGVLRRGCCAGALRRAAWPRRRRTAGGGLRRAWRAGGDVLVALASAAGWGWRCRAGELWRSRWAGGARAGSQLGREQPGRESAGPGVSRAGGRASCVPRWSAGRVHRRDACGRDAGGAHPADRWQRPRLAWG